MSSSGVLIAGGGLAGACAAFCLSRAGHAVQLLEAEAPGAGASGAAAGSVNPFMARKARPTWRLGEALDALRWITRAAGAEAVFDETGVLRPARSEKQAGFFQHTASEHPTRTQWLASGAVAERFPAVQSPHGALWIPDGGAADVPALVEALLNAACRNGAAVDSGARVTGWTARAEGVAVDVEREDGVESIEAARLLLCVGQGFGLLPALAPLALHAVKGQTLRLRRPPALEGAALPGSLSSNGYVVPQPGGDGTLLAGSTYEHDFDDLRPTDEGRRYILGKVSQMLPPLAEAEVVEARAGARVSPPGSHLPAVGPLPGGDGCHDSRRIWVFTALGSRGLLTAPLLARALPSFFDDPARIPDAVRAQAA
ncbi:MAG: FAD-binding oxidoreductase [Bacteroidetes bacterium QS_8_68_28]|jgi:glycine/D-amino acid oxidase-like deaminating enzyme|nr:MAG: FAD-binding oxidoreductase [Bacteroidetes bacterium QS_8_68_28]